MVAACETLTPAAHALHFQDRLRPPPNGLLRFGFPYTSSRLLCTFRTGWAPSHSLLEGIPKRQSLKPAGSRLSKHARSALFSRYTGAQKQASRPGRRMRRGALLPCHFPTHAFREVQRKTQGFAIVVRSPMIGLSNPDGARAQRKSRAVRPREAW